MWKSSSRRKRSRIDVTQQRYTAVAIVLHWAIAAAILFNIGLAWWMHPALDNPATQARGIIAFQAHKSIGLTVLLLSLMRLGWRFTHAPPPLPAAMPAWEKLAALATHWAFYALIILIPFTGWLYVSAGWSMDANRPLVVPTLYFGLFQIPHLFGLTEASLATRASVANTAIEAHELLVWATLALLALHVGAALKHLLIDRDEVVAHMIPGAPTPLEPAPASPQRRAVLLAGAGLTLAFAVCVGAFLLQPLAAPTVIADADVTEPSAAPEAPAIAATPSLAPETTAPAATTDATPPSTAAPAAWTVAQAQSAITFAGVHAGVPFEGRFARWRAEIVFDPDNLGASHARVTVETASASDGVSLHDQSLPQAEWFDVANHPTATFETSSFRALPNNRYEARGTLTLKGKALPIALPFTLTLTGNRAVVDGRVSVRRANADLGMQSDPDAEYVSAAIRIGVHVEATRAP